MNNQNVMDSRSENIVHNELTVISQMCGTANITYHIYSLFIMCLEWVSTKTRKKEWATCADDNSTDTFHYMSNSD